MRARDEQTATKSVRCWCFIFLEKLKNTSAPPPPLPPLPPLHPFPHLLLVRPRVKSSRQELKKGNDFPEKTKDFLKTKKGE